MVHLTDTRLRVTTLTTPITKDSRTIFLANLLRWALVFIFVAKVFGDGMFRIPGLEKDAGFMGMVLSAIRGIVVYGSVYGAYPLLILYFVVGGRRARRFRWDALCPVLLLISFIGVMCFVSPAQTAVKFRLGRFLWDALPAMLCMLHCTDRKGIEMVRGLLVAAAGTAIVILIASGRFVPLLQGDMAKVNYLASELGVEYAERFVLESNPITTGMMFYLAALAGLSLSFDVKNWRSRLVVLLISLISVALAFLTGARGPLVAFLVALVAFVGFSRFSISRRLLIGILSCSILSGALVMLPEISPESAKRAYGILGQVVPALDIYGTSGAIIDVDGRNMRFHDAAAAPISWFGRGVGAYGEDTGNPTDYVHNVFLEAYYETGVMGLIIIGSVFAYCLARLLILSSKGSHLALFCLTGLIFYLADAQLSGTLLYDIGSLSFLVLSCMTIAVEKRNLLGLRPLTKLSSTNKTDIVVQNRSTTPKGFTFNV